MNAVLKYPGAKNRLASWICEYIPEHKVYVEPFFGSGAVFFNKEPSYLEIINDIDGDVVNFFQVLRNNSDEIIDKIRLTPYARDEYNDAYSSDGDEDPAERARIFAVKCWQGFGCGNRYKNGYRRGIGETSPNPARAWAKLPETLLLAADRLKNAQIENYDAISLIESVKGENTFIYCDPPYLEETRKKYLYNYEMEDEAHERLLDVLVKSDCKVMISGYENEMYNKKLEGWHKACKNTTAECSVKRTEVIWMNYEISDRIEMKGQIDFEGYIKDTRKIFPSCTDCVCKSCLWHQSGRCPHGGCYDDRRAVSEPYNIAHPNEPLRTTWSRWAEDGEQAHWCRGGVFHPVGYCEQFVKFKGLKIQECLKANVAVFQDGYIDCSLIDNFGCEACYEKFEGKDI